MAFGIGKRNVYSCPMGKSYQVRENVFVLPVDMENRPVEDIARDAVASIMKVCDQVGKQREAERKAREEKGGMWK